MFEELEGKGLIIHHWDTDGISSAKLLIEKLKEKDIDNKTPELGNYFLTNKELKEFEKNDFIIIADMSLPEKNVLRLSKNAKVMIFDHHLGKIIKNVFHHNPILKGEDPYKYPSASWIVNDYLENDVNLYAILGVIGDYEEKIKQNKEFYEIIQKFCKEKNLSFEDLHKMVYLLDSNYKIGDKKAVENAPYILLNTIDPHEILENKKWNRNIKNLDKEINEILNEKNEEINGIIVKKINTPYNIISTVTRKISWSSKKNTVVVNSGFFDDKDQIYMRSTKSAEPMIKRGKDLGLKCGGKKEVLGAIVTKEKTQDFLSELINYLKS